MGEGGKRVEFEQFSVRIHPAAHPPLGAHIARKSQLQSWQCSAYTSCWRLHLLRRDRSLPPDSPAPEPGEAANTCTNEFMHACMDR